MKLFHAIQPIASLEWPCLGQELNQRHSQLNFLSVSDTGGKCPYFLQMWKQLTI